MVLFDGNDLKWPFMNSGGSISQKIIDFRLTFVRLTFV